MKDYSEAKQINELLSGGKKILLLQADNPDGDSLGSAIALENILEELGHKVVLYCALEVPSYLRYIEGWDRVQSDIPSEFDLSIIVDVSTDSLFESLNKKPEKNLVAKRPSIIIDHHFVEKTIEHADIICAYNAVATAEIIYELGRQLKWPLSKPTLRALLAAILSDSLGLTTENTSSRSVEIVAEIVKKGVGIYEVENARRNLSKKSPELLKYKGRLLQRIEYYDDGRISVVDIPWEEIEKYSKEYNPSVLVLDDMRQTTGVEVAIAFKVYNNGKITAKIRCNQGSGIADKLSKHFGGGGHTYASGFKVLNNSDLEELKKDTVNVAANLLDKIKK